MIPTIQISAIAATLFAGLEILKGGDGMDKFLIPSPPVRRARAQDSGIGWNERLLLAAARPPKDARFIENARKKKGECDTLKMCYVTGKWTVNITQTVCMFSLQVAHADWNDTTRLSVGDVEAIAREFLADAEQLQLTEPAPGDAFGRARVPEGDVLKRIPWARRLWWMEGEGRAVIWFMKDDGHPSMRDKGCTIDFNEYWFTTPTTAIGDTQGPENE